MKEDIAIVECRYHTHITNLEDFFKSRITYVIENTLKHIELEEFLDHIVQNNNNIQFIEFRDLIMSIFGETAIEFTVLLNANRSANQHSIASFENIGSDLNMGLLYRYRKCKICSRYLDEIVESKNKSKLPARRGTLINPLGFGGSDSDEDFDQPFIDPFSDNLSLYECGHCFHIKCIERHIQQSHEEAQFASQKLSLS